MDFATEGSVAVGADPPPTATPGAAGRRRPIGRYGIAVVLALGSSVAFVAADSSRPAWACFQQSTVYVQAQVPDTLWGAILTGAVYHTSGDYCGDYMKVLGQRKVCGFWGCNYETKETRGWDPKGGGWESLYPNLLTCQPGTHRYQSVAWYGYYPAFDAGSLYIIDDHANREWSC